MKQTQRLSLKTLRRAGQVRYKKISLKTISEIKTLFLKHLKKDSPTLRNIPPRARFLYFYIWRVYFHMLSWPSFADILNELNNNITPSHVDKVNRIDQSVYGGIFGITISAIVAGVAAAASKAATVAATTAAVVGSSTAASTIVSSVAGGVGGALAGAATEAIIKNS